jgi:pimeloyl-ACP methyl ester carboxylesterase
MRHRHRLHQHAMLGVTVGLLLGTAALAPAPAKAEPSAAATSGARVYPCDEAPEGHCGIVQVPLDRADPSRGTVPIFFEYYQHRNPGPTNEAILATLGGPGASLTQLDGGGVSDFFSQVLFDPLLDTRDLILLDQRGVGRSDAIDCEQVQNGSEHIYRDVRACGKQLGFASSLYGSDDVARDIEAVRAALGIDKLDFYGGSYAALDIQAYAVRFPGHLRSAVLDSPSTTLRDDDFDFLGLQANKRSIRLICERSPSCSAERRDTLQSLAWLARRLRRQPLEGAGYDTSGNPHHVRLTEAQLIWSVIQTDAGGFVSLSEIGAAADALRAGDPVPLLRLAAEGEAAPGDGGDPVAENSQGDFYARFCTDFSMPWDKNASIPTRLRQWRAVRDALPRDRFSPFSIDGWLAPFPIGPIGPDPCIVWPAPQRRVAPPIPPGAKFPGNVPALILSGDLDFDAPSAGGRLVARAWPNSRFVEIANSGHHTAVDGRFDCSDELVVNFISKRRPGDAGCASATGFGVIPAVGRFAATAAHARQAHAIAGDRSTRADRKVATVATAAVTDAMRRTFLDFEQKSGRGLRGGTFSVEPGETGVTDNLNGVRFARDVVISGTVEYTFETESVDATITVSGPGTEDGTLEVTGVWFATLHEATVLEVNGKLGGRSVSLRVPAT